MGAPNDKLMDERDDAMRMNHRMFLWGLALTLLCLAIPDESSASRARQMSFEEVTTQATVIVLGRVSKIPEMAVHDPETRDVYRRNQVKVQEYLKGSGPTPEIEVITLGGDYDTDGLGVDGPRIQAVDYLGAVQLPPVGTDVLLFLRPYPGGEAFMIYSVSHGLVPVQEGSQGQERFVHLLFRDPDLASPEAAANYRERYPVGSAGREPAVVDRCAVSDLKAVVDRVLNRKRKPPEPDAGTKTP